MKNRYIQIISLLVALLSFATFPACELDDKVEFLTDRFTEQKPGVNITDSTGYENGYAYVDLGLSVKWATCNVGASKPEAYGDYFAWGETKPKTIYDWNTYKWCNGSETTLTKYNIHSGYGVVDYKTQLDLSDDAAHVNWGGNWRMPTDAEWKELREQCIWAWTMGIGIIGYTVISKSNGNRIFLPAAGYHSDKPVLKVGIECNYWSSSLYKECSYEALFRNLRSDGVGRSCWIRALGLSVRPVLDENKSGATTPPTVTTAVVTQITETSAVVGGKVTSDGGASVTERGVVYSTKPNPVITNLNNTIRPCGSGTGEFTYTITGLQSNTPYYVRAYAKNDAGTAYGEEVSFTTNNTEHGYEYVDLGLSVKWATMNVGASKPEDYGNYYAWGEVTKSNNINCNWLTYEWCDDSDDTLTKYNTSDSLGVVDNITQLELNDDVAHFSWGGAWRMPTDSELTELKKGSNCTWSWITQNGVSGYKVTSKINGNSIFLPAAGYRPGASFSEVGSSGNYWSSSLHELKPNCAWRLRFNSEHYNINRTEYNIRCFGFSIRPVCP